MNDINENELGFKIFVRNIDFEITVNEVINKFKKCGHILKWHFPRKDPSKIN